MAVMAKASRKTTTQPEQAKECPFCAETIKARARVCKHCGRDLPAATSPTETASLVLPQDNVATAALPPAPGASFQVLNLLATLVDKNLVVYEEESNGQGRYRLLETVRQYARDRMQENEEAHTLRSCHRDHFLALVEEAKPNLQGPEQVQWLNRLETEHDNLRAALEWCLTDEEEGPQMGMRLAGALSMFWRTRGHLSEGRERSLAALARPGAQGRTKARAAALNGVGLLGWMQGDYSAARVSFEESLALQREIGDKRGTAASLNNLGLVANDQGDTGSARSLYEECLAIWGELGDKHGMAMSLGNLGPLDCRERNFAASRVCLAECLRLCRVLGDKYVTASALEGYAALARAQQQPDRAVRLHGASDALRAAFGVPLPPSGREQVDRELADLCAILGEATFDTAWAASHALTWEKAIEYAMQDETP